ncbi:Crp/Fnr family transcriptional regulator [Methylobacterium dankookense]|uniref:Nitrogen fixation regulation protein FixK n=1 Tax=Methylobacterium dankookense TaxID=560405 RepID=A0A564G8X0_9HYPH|nr:Crp/Fnr family transcriptional regulator [Methylobacterium dankookense]GJD57659.1 hypothetical protein IFDJLNFL_3566 [Methylobacterium dankookense]VUF15991.1 Nitrogen fixation regulation protein FixK [Methylobacterium dankookense]
MIELLIRKLAHSAFLTEADCTTLRQLNLRTREVPAQQDLIREDDRPENVILILSDFTSRYKILDNGKRQIMALLVPGDFCDLHVAILGQMDHSIATLTASHVAEIPRGIIEDLTNNYPSITRALWWATLADEGTLREWLVNMGQRPADQQMAHLFCELHLRLLIVGLAKPSGCILPLTQKDLGDVLGLSGVHVNRTLQDLRSQDLVDLRKKWLQFPNLERLRRFCGFSPKYLHLTPRVNDSSSSSII